MTRLGERLVQPIDPDQPVALCFDPGAGTERCVRNADFLADVRALHARLAGEPSGGWILLTDDAYAFAVGLFALWSSGNHAISPPNEQPGTLEHLRSRAAGALSDREDLFVSGLRIDPLHPNASAPASRDVAFERLDRDAVAVEFFTSGTTGDAKPILKSIRHLEDEVEELGTCWNEVARGAVVFASASHQHLYGVLFGVLWPLCSGHVFASKHFLHAGELIPRLLAAGDVILASVPTHLNRLAGHASMAELRSTCRAVFSSGGPLPAETAHRLADRIGHAPIEILGSTETGGIAWRRQDPESADSSWTPFPSARVAADPETGTLRVTSPFVSEGAAPGDAGNDSTSVSAFSTGDRIALRGDRGRFELLGRADRVVKIGERRLDLAAMESQLRGHAFVDAVALTTLAPESEGPNRSRAESPERVAAVLVLSEAGWECVRAHGRREATDALRASLADDFAPVLQPRYWRFVLALPEDKLGKVTSDDLRALFEEADWGALHTDRPALLSEARTAKRIQRTAFVPRDLSCFPGHFPSHQLVPGVLQLDWALALAEVWMNQPARVTEIESLKLLMPLEPGARFHMRVERPEPTRIKFKLWYADEIFAKGRVRIAAAGEATP